MSTFVKPVLGKWPWVLAGGAPTPEEEAAAAKAKADADAAAAASKAQPITREEFTATTAQIAETLKTVNDTLAQFRQAIERPAPREEQKPPATQEITAEQYEEAARVGDGQVMRRYMDQERAKDRAALEARVGQIEAAGTESLAGVIQTTAIATLPYYKDYEKEIKDIIATMPPAGRINPAAQRKAYDMVIGGHLDEIRAKERDQAARAAANPDQAGRPGASGPTRQVAGQVDVNAPPSPEDLGGAEATAALSLVGRDADRQAQGMGYRNWADYMEKTKEYR